MQGLESLYKLGGRWITFGGGEPLLRRDLPEIAQYAKSLGFQVFISTNGKFLPERSQEFQFVDNFNLSLDGPQKIHDAVRGEGAFADTLRAAECAVRAGLPFSFQYVIASHNVDYLKDALTIAKQFGVWMMFQPATQWLDSSLAPNPLAPPLERYREAIDQLIKLKDSGAPVANSKTGLRHLRNWPNNTPLRCPAGRLMIMVEPDGTMLSCHQYEVGRFLQATDRPNQSLEKQFGSLMPPQGCVQCWCAPVVELALLYSLKPEPIYNTIRRFFL